MTPWATWRQPQSSARSRRCSRRARSAACAWRLYVTRASTPACTPRCVRRVRRACVLAAASASPAARRSSSLLSSVQNHHPLRCAAALFARCPICCLTFVHIENDVHGRFAVDTFTPTLCDGASGDHLRAAVMAAAQLTAGQVQTLLGDEIDAHAAEAVGTTQGVSAEERD
jgi:hypothetical protein